MTDNITGYRSNPQLKTLNAPEEWPGTPVDQKGRFLNLNNPFTPSWVEVFGWKFQKSPFRNDKKSEVWSPDIYKDDSWFKGTDDVIVWLGHSTFYIRMNGIQLLTDPVLYDIPFVKRRSELPVMFIVL